MPNTIILKHRGRRVEAPAGGTITPGHLVVKNSSGNLVVHASAAQKTAPMFAVEAENLNPSSGIAGGIDDNYVANDYVQAEVLDAGAQVYALLAANAAAVAKGVLLESAGDGTLRVMTDFTDAEIDTIGGAAICRSLEAVDNSAGGTPARIRVEVI